MRMRKTIYVPDQLHKQMEAFENSNPPGSVNWSEVAQQSFRMHIEKMKSDDELDRDALIRRLRASKDKHRTSAEAAGRTAGRLWAEKHAEYDEFCRLESVGNTVPEDASIEWVVSMIDPEGEKGLVPEDMIDPDVHKAYGDDEAFTEGFTAAALCVWWGVKAQI